VCNASEIEFSNCGLSGPISSSCVFRKAPRKWFHLRDSEFEVRMLESSQNDSDAAPLLSIELFDHDAQSPVDSRSCYGIDEGAAAFRDFISR
jgi:hypothetical protein